MTDTSDSVIPPEPVDSETSDVNDVESTTSEVSGCSDKKVVVCELLCYISFYQHCSTQENLKRLLIGSYSDDQIQEAKRILWDSVDKHVLKEYKQRKTTNNRSQAEANLSDLMEAFVDIDRKGVDNVVFAAVNLKALPQHKPEELNELSIVQRLAYLEKKLGYIENSVSENCVNLYETQEKTRKNANEIESHLKLIHDIAEERKSDNSNTVLNDIHEENIRGNSSIESEDVQSENLNTETNPAVVNKNNVSSSEIAEVNRDATAVNETVVNVDNKVQVGGLKNKVHCECRKFPPAHVRDSYTGQRPTALSSGPKVNDQTQFPALPRTQNGRHQSVVGTRPTNLHEWPRSGTHSRQAPYPSSSSTYNRRRVDHEGFEIPRLQYQRALRQGKQRNNDRQFFVYNVNNHYSVDNIYDHLVDTGVSVTDLFQRSHPHSKKKSFVLIADDSQASKIMNAGRWPMGIRVREYHENQ